MTLFDRKIRLRIFTDSRKIDIEELNVQFDIAAYRRREPNVGRFDVYNLGGATRALIEQESKYLEFFAGYASYPIGRIFKGFVDQASSLKVKTEWITTIEAIDAGDNKEYTSATVSKTFAKGTPVVVIFNTFAVDLNMPILLDYTGNDVLLSSETYMGPLRTALDEVCKDYGFSWSIQFGVLEVVKEGQSPIRDSVSIRLDKTNIIGIPEITKNGVKVKTPILPNLIPSRLITVPDDIQNTLGKKLSKSPKKLGVGGTYIIDSIKYRGERDSGQYEAEVDAWRNL